MVRLGNRVWEDQNGDGIQNPGEQEIAGFKVDLVSLNGAVISSTFTNGLGEYFFDEQATQTSVIGGVSIRFDINFWNSNNPTRRYEFTVPNQGDDPFTLLGNQNESVDSDANPNTGLLFDGEQSSLVNVSNSFQTFNDIDAGLIPINNPPVARDDNYDVVSEQRTRLDVLSNDSDLDGDPLTISLLTQPSGGGAFVSDNAIIYTSSPGFTGSEIFSYRISDGSSSDTATVRLNVTEPNNTPPVATNDTANTEFETPVAIDVLANDSDGDGDALSINSVGDPANGTVEIVDGTIAYTPDAGFSGQDIFDYVVTDGTDIATASVTVTVEDENNTPGVINGTGSANLLNGTPGEDTINGLGGDDTINGRAGNDTLFGNGNDDLIDGGTGNDSINGGQGNDTLIGNGSGDTLIGGAGNDSLDGGNSSDLLNGGNDDDTLFGGNSRDTLVGGSGDDVLRGNDGNDVLRGQSGADTFVLAAGEGKDSIRDFVIGTDLIGLADGLTFNDLSLSGRRIMFGSEILSTINFNTNQLSESDFVSI